MTYLEKAHQFASIVNKSWPAKHKTQ